MAHAIVGMWLQLSRDLGTRNRVGGTGAQRANSLGDCPSALPAEIKALVFDDDSAFAGRAASVVAKAAADAGRSHGSSSWSARTQKSQTRRNLAVGSKRSAGCWSMRNMKRYEAHTSHVPSGHGSWRQISRGVIRKKLSDVFARTARAEGAVIVRGAGFPEAVSPVEFPVDEQAEHRAWCEVASDFRAADFFEFRGFISRESNCDSHVFLATTIISEGDHGEGPTDCCQNRTGSFLIASWVHPFFAAFSVTSRKVQGQLAWFSIRHPIVMVVCFITGCCVVW